MTPTKVWLGIFGLWILLLSGALASLVGSPGAFQLYNLKSLLGLKHKQTAALREQLVQLQDEGEKLEKSKVVQQREIRRLLGYAAEDELIFDFSSENDSTP